MNEAILLKGDDYEGLFVNGKLVQEGETLNEGHERIFYFLELAESHEFNLKDMKLGEVSEAYNEKMKEKGGFDFYLSDVEYTISRGKLG